MHNQFEHGGNVYSAIRALGGSISDLIDFSANINPLGLADSVRKAIIGNLEGIIHYPDPEGYELKRSISEIYGVACDRITLGNGAVELLYALGHYRKFRRALIPAPTFNEYERSARAAGTAVEYLILDPKKGFAIDIGNVAGKIRPGDIVFICNPNNPTGTLLAGAEIKYLVRTAATKDAFVVVDESFSDFLEDDAECTCRPLLTRYSNLLIIHSLTKFYAIPGLRLGFALASPSLTAALHTVKDQWNVNSLAQAAGVAALADVDYRQASKRYMAEAKSALYSALAKIPGIRPFLPAVNYVFADISGTGFSACELKEALIHRRILIRDCSNYPGLGHSYIRVAVKRPEQNASLITALKTVLEGRG